MNLLRIKYILPLFCTLFIILDAEKISAQVGGQSMPAETINKKSIHFPNCNDPRNPNKKVAYSFCQILEEAKLGTVDLEGSEGLVLTEELISFTYNNGEKLEPDNIRLIEAVNLILKFFYRDDLSATISKFQLVKQRSELGKKKITIVYLGGFHKISDLYDLNRMCLLDNFVELEKNLFDDAMNDFIANQVKNFCESPDGSIKFKNGIHDLYIEGKTNYASCFFNAFVVNPNFSFVEPEFTYYPKGYFNFNGWEFCPVDPEGNPLLKVRQENDFGANKYQKFTFESKQPIEIGFSVDPEDFLSEKYTEKFGKIGKNVGLSFDGTPGYYELCGYDNSGNKKECVEIIFNSFGYNVGFGGKLIMELLNPYTHNSKMKGSQQNFIDALKRWCDRFTINVGIPPIDGKEKFIDVNFPMSLNDFYGHGYIASVSVGVVKFEQILFWFPEISSHKNKRFEQFSVQGNFNTSVCLYDAFIKNIELGGGLKYGFFQPGN